ncbi:MurR/RpiR family transcriptional regulator [Atopobiaceae bacterium 24-176]
MDVFQSLRQSRELTENERMIAGYVLDHPEEVARMSSRELARRTYTNPTAVLRFSRKLGFDNFNDFKVNIVSDLKRARMDGVRVRPTDAPVAVCDKMAHLNARIVEETKRKLSMRTLRQVASLIEGAAAVDFFATDLNAAVASYATHILCLAGKLCCVLDTLDRSVYSALVAPADHVAFLVSKSGMDRTLLEVADVLKGRHVPTVAITASPNAPLAGRCDHVLEAFYFTRSERFGEMVFGTSCKYLYDTLFAMVYAGSTERVEALARSYDALYYDRLDRSGVPGGSLPYYDDSELPD